MWLLFMLACTFIAGALFLPGALVSRCLVGSWSASIGFAPLISVALYIVFGIIWHEAGITANWMMMVLPPIILAAAAFVFSKTRAMRCGVDSDSRTDAALLLLAVFIGIAVSAALFIAPLDGPCSFDQHSDNLTHLGNVSVMASDGDFCILHTTGYSRALEPGQMPYAASYSYYPAGISLVAALAVQAIGAPVPLALNAAIFVFGALVYASGSFLLMRTLFGENHIFRVGGAVATMAFAAFPYALCMFGPLYPNLASMACFPAAASAFILAVEAPERRNRVACFALFAVACVAFWGLQPNTIFALAVFLAPFCVYSAFRSTKKRFDSPEDAGKRRFVPLCAAVGFALFTVVVWVGLFYSPFLHGVTSFYWPELFSWQDAVWSLLLLGMRTYQSQPVLALFVLLGFAAALLRPRYRWLAFSYLFIGIIYLADVSWGGYLKQLLAGFWYTDPWRVSASVAVIGAPVAAMGMGTVISAYSDAIATRQQGVPRRVAVLLVSAVVCGITLVPFEQHGYGNFESSALSTVSNTIRDLNGKYDPELPVSYDEEAFMERVRELVGEDALVLNVPHDGSFFGSCIYDLNVYYRAYGQNETEASRAIRTGLCNITTDASVRETVNRTGARYVMLLDASGYQEDEDGVLWNEFIPGVDPDDWTGMTSITDETPGFEVVLEDGPLRLYRITALDGE